MQIPLLSGAYEGISKNVSSQELINWFYEKPSPRESNDGAVLPVHGANLFGTLGNGDEVVRGMLFDPAGSTLYVVAGSNFYEVDVNGDDTDRGNLNTSSGKIQMALNPASSEILVVDGTNGYIYDISGTSLSVISDSDYPDTADACSFINGRFLVNDPTTPGRWWFSAINDGTDWPSTNFATAESIDSIVKDVIVDRRVIWLFGDTKSEVWYDTGDVDFLFQRFDQLNHGIVAANTVQLFDNGIMWLQRSSRGTLHAVVSNSDLQMKVVSNPQISRKWHELSSTSDAFAYTYQLDGHEFYVVTFPTADATWAYDAVTGEWHQRSGAFSAGSPTREIISSMAFAGAWGGHIAGDSNATGKLFSLQESVYTFDSTNMERRLTSPLISMDNEAKLLFSEVQIDIEEGTIQSGDSGDDRQLTLSWSKDGGHTYSSGVQLDIGESASDGFDHRLIKRKLGWGRLWNFRIYTDTPRKIVIKGAYGRTYGEPLEGSG